MDLTKTPSLSPGPSRDRHNSVSQDLRPPPSSRRGSIQEEYSDPEDGYDYQNVGKSPASMGTRDEPAQRQNQPSVPVLAPPPSSNRTSQGSESTTLKAFIRPTRGWRAQYPDRDVEKGMDGTLPDGKPQKDSTESSEVMQRWTRSRSGEESNSFRVARANETPSALDSQNSVLWQ